MSTNSPQPPKIVEVLNDSTFFQRPAGEEGFAIVVVRLSGWSGPDRSGTRFEAVLEPGQRLSEGLLDRLSGHYRAYRVDMRKRSLVVSHQCHPAGRATVVQVEGTINYHVADPRTVALDVQDAEASLKAAVLGCVNGLVEALSYEDLTSEAIASGIGRMGVVYGIQVDGADIAGMKPDPEQQEAARTRLWSEVLQTHPYFVRFPDVARSMLSAANEQKLEAIKANAQVATAGVQAYAEIMRAYLDAGGDPTKPTTLDDILATLRRQTDFRDAPTIRWLSPTDPADRSVPGRLPRGKGINWH